MVNWSFLRTKKEQAFNTNCGEYKDYPATFDHSNANPKEERKDKNIPVKTE